MRLLLLIFPMLWWLQAQAVDIDGQTEFASLLKLNSSINARIEKILVTPGQRVSAGELLLIMVDTGFQSALSIAQAGVDEMLPRVAQMQTELDKAQELFDRDSLAPVELEQASQNHSIALAHLAAAEAKLENARFELSQTRLHAPMQASVLSVDTQENRFINITVSDQPLITLVDNINMIARGLLAAEHWNSKLLNAPAQVKFQNKSYKGKVIEIGQQVVTTKNNHPALELTVSFTGNGEIPARLPVQIHIDSN